MQNRLASVFCWPAGRFALSSGGSAAGGVKTRTNINCIEKFSTQIYTYKNYTHTRSHRLYEIRMPSTFSTGQKLFFFFYVDLFLFFHFSCHLELKLFQIKIMIVSIYRVFSTSVGISFVDNFRLISCIKAANLLIYFYFLFLEFRK